MVKKLTKEELANDYQKNGIVTLSGLEHVRKRPGMYVGSTRSLDGKNPAGLIHIAQEILSNAIDEAYAGFGKEITMIVHKDNSMTVIDHGRGLPKGKNFDYVTRSITVLNSSGKFDESSYSNSLGQNGIGQKATAALSKYFDAEVVTNAKEHYHVRFKQSKPLIREDLPYKKGMQTGTTITFLPDDEIFSTINWDTEALVNMLEQSAFLTPKVKFIFEDERKKSYQDDAEHDHYYREWFSKNGMPDYVSYIAGSEDLVKGLKKPIAFKGTYEYKTTNGALQSDDDQKKLSTLTGNITLEGALIYTNSSGETTLSFANGARTSDGGPHEDGALQAIGKAFKDYFNANYKKLKFKKSQAIDAQDTKEGLILALSVKIPGNILMFTSQAKTQLATPEAKEATNQVVYEQLTAWLADHPKIAKSIIENMIDSKEARDAALKAKKAARQARKTKNGNGKLVVSTKLKPASGKDPKKKSLFITEGDSASALLTLVRDKKYQAVFPLRGKILNTYSAKLSKALQNEEITTIASVLGAGIGSGKDGFDEKSLEYDKIIILTDSDDDGFHITSLLTTLFYKLFPGLIENGHLYKVTAPLYRTELKNKKTNDTKIELAYAESEKEAFDKRVKADEKAGYKLVRAERWKGLGSMSKINTYDYIANPSTRKITQITVDDAKRTSQMLNIWMGNDAELRKEQIENTVDFDSIVLD